MEKITAAITAGGQSSRFGSDKALAMFGGQTLLQRVAGSLSGCQTRLLIAPVGKYHLPGWDVVPDLRPGCGPLAGLETALAKAPAGWVAFAGVDMPGLNEGYWGALCAELVARPPSPCLRQGPPPQVGRVNIVAIQAVHEGQPQPLAALYHTDLLPRITALLDAGERRLRLAALPENTVLVPDLAAGYFRNVNRPGDLTGPSAHH